jgi:peptidoglycan/LPS O-acetylase OafA/YrhL
MEREPHTLPQSRPAVSAEFLTKEDSEFLSIVRGAFIVIMVFCHVSGMWFWRPYSEFLAVVVPTFFFMSGAVSFPSYFRTTSTSSYIVRRFWQLLIPYYLMCVICLVVSIALNHGIRGWTAENLIRWLTITPHQSIMPFPLVQAWFLHCLLLLTLISPLLFHLYYRRRSLLYLFLLCSIAAATIQLFFNLGDALDFRGHNLFRPLVYSLLFCLGFLVFQLKLFRKQIVLWCALAVSLAFIFSLLKYTHINPDYVYHMPQPDIFFIVGCLCTIWLLLLFRKCMLTLYHAIPGIPAVIKFFNKQTFALYLLHTFSIFLAEVFFGFGRIQRMTMVQGILKFIIVLMITCLMAPAFTMLSQFIAGAIIKWQMNLPLFKKTA